MKNDSQVDRNDEIKNFDNDIILYTILRYRNEILIEDTSLLPTLW
jgi:hypothetical protein